MNMCRSPRWMQQLLACRPFLYSTSGQWQWEISVAVIDLMEKDGINYSQIWPHLIRWSTSNTRSTELFSFYSFLVIKPIGFLSEKSRNMSQSEAQSHSCSLWLLINSKQNIQIFSFLRINFLKTYSVFWGLFRDILIQLCRFQRSCSLWPNKQPECAEYSKWMKVSGQLLSAFVFAFAPLFAFVFVPVFLHLYLYICICAAQPENAEYSDWRKVSRAPA